VVYRHWSILSAVWNQQEWLLPAKQVWANLGRAELSRVVNLSLLALLVEVAGVGGAIGYLVSERRRKLPPGEGARFATLADLRKANLLNGVKGYSVLLGRFAGQDVRYSGDSHFFVNGPSRSGKGRGFVMTNLLEWRGSVLVLDVKGENLELTGPARAAMGQEILVFAQGSESTHCWNPLDFVRPWPTRATDVMNMAAALVEEPERGEKFWAQTARSLLAGLLAYVLDSPTMEGRRTLRPVQKLLVTPNGLVSTLQAILELEPKLQSFVVESFRGYLTATDKNREQFKTSVETALQGRRNKLVADATSKSDFDIREFRRKAMTVYIVAPVSDFATVEPLIRLFIQQIHDLSLRERHKPDERHKVLLMLDEFYQSKRLPEVVVRAPLVGGFGFRIAVIAQNLPQIDERYSKVTREAFLGNMDVRFFIAANDDTTAEAISRDLGRKYVKRETWSERTGFGAVGGVTRQSSWAETQLLSADNILSDDKALLLVRGHPGVVLDKLNFYTDAAFIAVVEDASALSSMLKIPALAPVPEWPLFEPAPAGTVIPENPIWWRINAK
jgi:type IV secretion system protein VirD4